MFIIYRRNGTTPFTQSQQPAASPREYILTIPVIQMIQISQASQVAQRVQALVLGTSRQLHFVISPKKTFNPLFVTSAMGNEAANSGL